MMKDNKDEFMSSDKVAALLVQLNADYTHLASKYGYYANKDYAQAVGIAIRMLTD